MASQLYSLLLKEVNNILTSERAYNDIKFKFIIHNKDTNTTITLFETLDTKADYNNNISDVIFLNFFMGLGDFVYDIFNYRNNLEVTMVKSFNNKPYDNITYKAVLVNSENPLAGVNSNLSRDILNKADIKKVTLQLLEKPTEVIRSIHIDGIYKGIDIKNLIHGIMFKELSKIKINGKGLEPIINIVPPDNKTVYNSYVIPTGTRLIDLPSFIQDTRFGIYQGDIGVYFKSIRQSLMDYKTCFFMYPLYTRREDDFDSLYIYHSDAKLNKAADNTYNYKNKKLKIITSEVNVLDKGEIDLINTGSSLTYSKMENIYNYNSSVTDDKITYNNKSQVGNETLEKEDNLNIDSYVGNEVNMFRHYARLLNKEMGLYQFTWLKSDHTLLLPGMNVTVFFQIDKEIKQLQGVLQSYFSSYNQAIKSETTSLMIKLKEKIEDA